MNSVKRIYPSIIFFTNPLLIIYTPLEKPGSSPTWLFFFVSQEKCNNFFETKNFAEYAFAREKESSNRDRKKEFLYCLEKTDKFR